MKTGAASKMRAMIGVFLVAVTLAFAGAPPAAAHPHVQVNARSEVLFAPDGKVVGVRHHWTFDEMFSTFATQGLDTDKDGKLSREELAGLADVNVTSLKEYGYFTFAQLDGKRSLLKDPVDYFLEHENGLLTLHFTLPLRTPASARSMMLEVYDQTYFVAFSFAEKDPLALTGAPPGCSASISKPQEADLSGAQRLGESFFDQLGSGSGFGAQFATKVKVECP